MLELLINPKNAERKPWQMFFIGLFYAFLSLLVSYLLFSKDPALSKYLGAFVVTFCVIFSLPFMYYTIKLEERKDIEYENELSLLEEHGKALLSFIFLFLGFLIAFSVWYVFLPNGNLYFNAQIETFCQINRPNDANLCFSEYGLRKPESITSSVTSTDKLFFIISNNIYVLIFTLILSIAFGAGALFILAWNASVIAAAIGIFVRTDLGILVSGIFRYMTHGVFEIAAYFIAALAGGILSIAVIRHDTKSDKFWSVIQDSLNLLIIAIVVLIIAGLIEVFITPKLF